MNLLLESLKALLFGIVEGVTEWLPISSTGHMILLDEFVQLQMTDAFKSMFEVVIQLGAILAVLVQYWRTFWAVGTGLLRWQPMSVAFVRNLLIAFFPALWFGLRMGLDRDDRLALGKVGRRLRLV